MPDANNLREPGYCLKLYDQHCDLYMREKTGDGTVTLQHTPPVQNLADIGAERLASIGGEVGLTG